MLDLDAVRATGGEITIGGKEYKFRAVIMAEYLEVLKVFEEMEHSTSYATVNALAIKAMKLMATDLPESAYKNMDKEQVRVFITYLKEVQLGVKPDEDDSKNVDAGGAVN